MNIFRKTRTNILNNPICYIVSFLIPSLVYLIMGLTGINNMTYVFVKFFVVGIAGLIFYFFIDNSINISIDNSYIKILFSTSYALCSYVISQESSLRILAVYAMFPLLFYFYELMLDSVSCIPFIVLSGILIMVETRAFVGLTFLLLLHAFFYCISENKLNFGEILRIILIFICIFGLGAFALFYHFAPIFDEYDTYVYDGFEWVGSPSFILSRLFPGSASSVSFLFQNNRMDLYVCLFFLMISLTFFINKSILLRKRIAYFVYTIIVFFFLFSSAGLFVLNGFVNETSNTVKVSFFFVFWFLYLAAMTFENLNILKIQEISALCILILLFETVSYIFYAHNIKIWSFVLQIVFTLFYAAIIIIAKKHKNIFPYICLSFLIFFEISFNIIATTNNKLISKNVSIDSHYLFNEEKTTDTSVGNEKNTLEDRYRLKAKQAEDDEFLSFLSKLFLTGDFSDEQIRKDTGVKIPSKKDKINYYVNKLGIEGDFCREVDISLDFVEDSYKITDMGHNIYNISMKNEDDVSEGYVEYTYDKCPAYSKYLYLYDNLNGDYFKLDREMFSKGYKDIFYVSSPLGVSSYNVRFEAYRFDEEIYEKLKDKLKLFDEKDISKGKSYIFYDIVGLVVSFVFFSMILIFCLYDNKESIATRADMFFSNLSNHKNNKRFKLFIRNNNIYILSFLIPFLTVMFCYLVNDCYPFGENTIFDDDGFGLILPNLIDNIHIIRDNNLFLSPNRAYMYSIYNDSILNILNIFKVNLSTTQIVCYYTLLYAICIGISGFSMSFYMMHRYKKRSDDKKCGILLAACIYALNAYMLRMHSFILWYVFLMLFPLLIYAFERMIYKKKITMYIIFLTASMYINLQLAFYSCIFLVLIFFLAEFKGIKDFLKKGLIFALSSILSAFCGYVSIMSINGGYGDLLYSETDAVWPKVGLNENFLSQFKNYMLFSDVKAITSNDSGLYLYFGIFTFILMALYFFSKRYSMSDKIKRFLLLAFLTVSFNERTLLYLWNRMHYQTRVPNRNSFLMAFVAAVIAYDGFMVLYDYDKKRFSIFVISGCVLMIICHVYNKDMKDISLVFSMLMIMLYSFVIFYASIFNASILHAGRKKNIYNILSLIFLIEIFSNSYYFFNDYESIGLEQFAGYRDFEAISDFYKKELEGDESPRVAFVNNIGCNYGQVYDIPTTSGYGSFTTLNHLRMSLVYGFVSVGNGVETPHISDKMGMSLSGTGYIFLDTSNTAVMSDLDLYEYVGCFEGFYILKNNNAFSKGTYAPASVRSFKDNSGESDDELSAKFYNFLCKCYIGRDDLCEAKYLSYNESGTQPDTYHYTDGEENDITTDEAEKIFNAFVDREPGGFKMKLRYKAEKSGYQYLHGVDNYALGYMEKGEEKEFIINYPAKAMGFKKDLCICSFDEEVFEKFYAEMSKNQMYNMHMEHDTIKGDTDYEKAGYTMFSIPYDRSYTAYVDGKKAEIETLHDAIILVKTPAGKHNVELKYVPYGMKKNIYITFAGILVTILSVLIYYIILRRPHCITDGKNGIINKQRDK